MESSFRAQATVLFDFYNHGAESSLIALNPADVRRHEHGAF
jgi:hypothetical protein